MAFVFIVSVYDIGHRYGTKVTKFFKGDENFVR